MNVALRPKACEQPLRDSLLEVQMDRRVGENASILEGDWPDWSLASPFGELLILLARRA